MSEQDIEKKIQSKGLNAPRLTPALIDAKIKEKTFHVFGDTCLTVCCLTLVNGFTVTGESACASPDNFNAEIGEEIAFEQARGKIWLLEGYLLKEKLFLESQLSFDRVLKDSGEMSFGMAVEAMKKGKKVARSGWNGSGMFAYAVPERGLVAAELAKQLSTSALLGCDDTAIIMRAHLMLKTAQGDVATWAPSCSDALSDDWVIIE